MKPGYRIGIVALIQTLILCGMVGMRQWTLATGTAVVLETQPIDPRSLFSGDYVRLNYRISDLKLEELAGDRNFRRNDAVYVVLAPEGEFWKAVSAHHEKPQPAAGQVAIMGRVEYAADTMWDPAQNRAVSVKHIHVKYGVEEYFVQEGTGRTLERPAHDEKVSIQVAVDGSGRSGIKAVLVDGKPKYVETLF